MAIRAKNETTLIDLTDGYSVILTNESYTFLGTTTGVDGTQSTSFQIQALCGAEQVSCSVGEISCPTGLSIVSDGKTPIPTLTVTATSALTKSGSVIIPVKIGDITISKVFSYAIAFKGATGATGTSVTVSSTSVTYGVSDSASSEPGSWSADKPTANPGQYFWTKTVVTYSDGKSTTTYSYALQGETGAKGETGTSVTVASTEVTYGSSTSASTQPSSWSATQPSVAEGSYLWTKTVVTYSDGKSTTTYTYAKQGEKGDKGDTGEAGEDAILLVITSSNGNIFKNTSIATILTAHVYKGGVEVTGSNLTALGTIKWYKDGGTTAVATGSELTINAGDISSKATYVAQLEG